MDVALVSIAVDSKEELGQEAKRLNIQTPMLTDEDAAVTKTYGIPLTYGGEPGHTFVLVGKDGRIKWAKDYAAPPSPVHSSRKGKEPTYRVRSKRTSSKSELTRS